MKIMKALVVFFACFLFIASCHSSAYRIKVLEDKIEDIEKTVDSLSDTVK
jgi:hypothetical protein